MQSSHPPPHEISDSLTVLRHHWWMIALGVILGLGAGGVWLQVQPPAWQASTSVLVHPVGQDTNVVGGRTQDQVNLDTQAQLVHSTPVAAAAAKHLGEHLPPDELARLVTVEVPANTSVLTIIFTGTTPAEAQAGSAAFAEAYLDHREQTAQAALGRQTSALSDKLEELDSSLSNINESLATTMPDTAAAANLENQRSTVSSQLDAMTGQLNELTTATVTAGDIISEARVPTDPARPHAAIVLASGTALGLVAGVGGAGLAERLARRVRRSVDLTRRLGLPVLAVLSGRSRRAPSAHSDEVLSPYDLRGRMVDRLRNEVLASIHGKIILVTSTSNGAGSSFVAGNLAASLSRVGHEVVVIGARVPDNVAAASPLTTLLGVSATPGLSEVLGGRASVMDALQPAARHPRMRVMTMGGTASATGLLQQPSLREVLQTVAAHTNYVVVDAPPTTTSADAQSLAGHADVALLVTETRRSKLADVADAADQLRRVGTALLGAVVVGPLRSTTGAGDRHRPDESFAVGDLLDPSEATGVPDGEPGELGEPGEPVAAPDSESGTEPVGSAPAKTNRPRPVRRGPHLPALSSNGTPLPDLETVVMPRLDDDAVAALAQERRTPEPAG